VAGPRPGVAPDLGHGLTRRAKESLWPANAEMVNKTSASDIPALSFLNILYWLFPF
jgi:hypothetical protein